MPFGAAGAEVCLPGGFAGGRLVRSEDSLQATASAAATVTEKRECERFNMEEKKTGPAFARPVPLPTKYF